MCFKGKKTKIVKDWLEKKKKEEKVNQISNLITIYFHFWKVKHYFQPESVCFVILFYTNVLKSKVRFKKLKIRNYKVFFFLFLF